MRANKGHRLLFYSHVGIGLPGYSAEVSFSVLQIGCGICAVVAICFCDHRERSILFFQMMFCGFIFPLFFGKFCLEFLCISVCGGEYRTGCICRMG